MCLWKTWQMKLAAKEIHTKNAAPINLHATNYLETWQTINFWKAS